jgi:competence protein ComEC
MRSPSHGAFLAGSALAWLAGVGAQLRQPALWPVTTYAWLVGAGVAAIGLGWALRRHAAGRSAIAAPLAGLALAGFGITGLHAAARLADALVPALEGRDLVVTGIVASLPQAGEAGWRFRFDVEEAVRDGQAVAVPRTLALGWYRGAHEDATLLQPGAELRAGERWRFGLRLRQPHGNANPHGFDYELYLFEQGVRATGYVRDVPPPLRLHDAAGHPVDRLRQRVRDAIAARVVDGQTAGILAALAVGDQAAIARDDWALFRDAGVAHLMSISGLHVTMFAWLAGLACAWTWRRSARAMLWLPTPVAARWGGVAAALGYAVFAGWGVPAQRTVLMLLTVTLLQSLGCRWPWPLVLLTSAVAVTCADPWALLQPGFWLSFMAVGLLMSSAGAGLQDAPAAARGQGLRAWCLRIWEALRGGLRTQVIATIGLAPLTLVFFQQVSLVGFFANLVAIPVVTLLITPLALLGALLAPLWLLAAGITEGLVAVFAWLVAWPQAVWSGAAAPPWAQGAALVAALLLVLPLPWRLRLLAIPLALPLLLPARALPAAGEFSVVAADVGQGSAVLVRTRDHLLVYDAGPRYSRDSDAGQRVLLPLLRALGETRIDELALSHRDTDHVGGAGALAANLPPAQLRSSFEPSQELQAALAPERALRCEAGQRWAWDDVAFEVLWPTADEYERARKPNALSCVLRVQGAGASLLLAGDIEAAQERALVAAYGAALRSDVLVVPHHGSKTSSSAAFLDAVGPRFAVVQAGYRNRFGHPADEVLQRYRERGITLRITPDCGAWRWTPGDAPEESCWRPLARRYWHHPGAAAP